MLGNVTTDQNGGRSIIFRVVNTTNHTISLGSLAWTVRIGTEVNGSWPLAGQLADRSPASFTLDSPVLDGGDSTIGTILFGPLWLREMRKKAPVSVRIEVGTNDLREFDKNLTLTARVLDQGGSIP